MFSEAQIQSTLAACWNRIGVSGDHSCPELEQWIHCRNCPVYSQAGIGLLDRPPPEGYLEEWSRLLVEQKVPEPINTFSVLVFRLADEWFALPTGLFTLVADTGPIHRLPHRPNELLLGLVNIQGELQLCVSLPHLLNLESATSPLSTIHSPKPRLLVLAYAGDAWVFPVSEVSGILRFPQDRLKPGPATLVRGVATFTRGLLSHQEKEIGLLDPDLLFHHLKRSLN